MRTTSRIGACLAAGLVLSLSGCARNPVTGEREFVMLSEAQEIAMGREADVEVRAQMGLYDDEALQRYTEEIGLELAARSHRPELSWSFAVVDSPAVNAFALPGGFIYLTRGIMAFLDDEADLAGVLGHEIGHVTARHTVRAYTRASGAQLGLLIGGIFSPTARAVGGLAESGLGVLFLRYGRDAELQADRLGAEYAAAAGWDPTGVRDMLTTLSRLSEGADRQGVPNWLSTHPEAADRVERIGPSLAELAAQGSDPSALRVNRQGYLDRIDGLVYGDNPDQGVVRGRDFLHPPLRFAVRFPDGWEVANSETQVAARQPGEEVYVLLQLVTDPDTRDLEALAVGNMRDGGYRLDAGGQTTIGGLDAFVGTFTNGTGTDRTRARVAYIEHGRSVFALGGLAGAEAYDRVEAEFNETIRSFRPLSDAEAEDIRPNRLRFYTVRAGDTWQSIAQDAGAGIVPSTTLAIMNGFPVNEQPRAGDRIKIVREG